MSTITLNKRDSSLTLVKKASDIKLVKRDATIKFNQVGRRGLSAYEVAVVNGFVGTEAEWLTSLNGSSVSTDKTYETTFTNQSSLTITHNLGKKPSVMVINSAGDQVLCDPVYVNNNVLSVAFSAPFSGLITLN